MAKRYIGIDLGGTTVKLGIVDENGGLLYKAEKPTRGEEGPEASLARIADHARELAEAIGTPWSNVAGVGMGLPGFLDLEKGEIIRLTNIPWERVPVRSMLEAELGLPVAIDNDANAAALGEAWSGAGAGFNDLICITLGTGVGGGIIVGGRLVHGLSGMAGEIGHIPVEADGVRCGCGQRGCLETISSATGMTRLAREGLAQGRHSVLDEAEKRGELTTREIFAAAKDQDGLALDVVDRATDALGRVMAMLSVVNNPAAFIVGGGVSRAGDELFTPLRRSYAKHTLVEVANGVQILPARLGNDAGLIGAAGLVWNRGS
ncbi:ROK family glucokinase [Desmospora profundinema]|uniref:Glucokinase n=1 Tax=Desmospora profundinema TaxID=1571184 RepID=A0ABU1ILI0_9BACL|nr:ROK family glucokinase [Desmospora profundinema]MDR6225642.1 glucokinase [Desmospora profundinema]